MIFLVEGNITLRTYPTQPMLFGQFPHLTHTSANFRQFSNGRLTKTG